MKLISRKISGLSAENVKTAIRKMTNWKAPGPDWGDRFKRFSTLHSRLTEHLQTCDVPTWMTKLKTTLIQKDPEKGNPANNYALSHAYHLCAYVEAAD